MMDLSETKLVTHKSCMDGSTCAAVFIGAGGKYENIVFSNPDHEAMDEAVFKLYNENQKQEIIIADVSITKNLAEVIDKLPHKIKLLDHHPSAMGLVDFEWCELSSEACGSKLLFEYLRDRNNSEKLFMYNYLVHLSDDRDRWLNKHPESLELEELHEVLGQELFVKRFADDSNVRLRREESFLLNIFRKKKDAYIQEKKQQLKIVEKKFNNETYRVAYVLSTQHVNELCKSIYDDAELKIDVVVAISGRKISMRAAAKCNLKVTDVVVPFGGGGHTKAGGVTLKGILGADLIDMVDSRLFEK